MKKILLLATLVLGMVSCMKDQSLDANLAGDGNFVLSVALPNEATRAAGEDSAKGAIDNGILNEYNVRYTLEVYDVNEQLAKRDQHTVNSDKTSFELRLIPGRHYRFVVWADFVKDGVEPYYNVANLREVSLTGTHNAMNESRDAYTAVFNTAEDGDKEVFSSASSIELTLTRPFAKLRVVTNDMKEIYSTLQSAVVNYTTPIYSTFNALAEEAGNPVSNVSKSVDFTSDAYEYAGEQPATDGKQTLFADYIFGTENGTVQFTLDVTDNVAALPQVAFNTAIPVERNYLTTIYGPVLTDFNKVTVTIDDNFEQPENVVDVWDGVSISEPAVEADPVTGEPVAVIDQPAELAWLAAYVNGTLPSNVSTFATRSGEAVNFVLGADIDLGGYNWTPIGTVDNNFVGTFDGKDHEIHNLNIVVNEAKEGKAHMGLFGYAKNATIKNLTIVNAYVNVACLDIDHSQGHIGAVVGSLEGTSLVEDVTVKGDIFVEATPTANGASRVAVVVGGNTYATVTLKNVRVEANEGSYLRANNNTGAIAGQLQGKTVYENCSSNIDVTVNKFFAGGIVGLAGANDVFTNCHTTGDVAVVAGREGRHNDEYRVGGIAGGWADGKTNVCTLTDCSYTGKVSGKNSDGSVAEPLDYAGYVGRGYTLANCAGSKVVIDGTEYVQAFSNVYGVYYVNGELVLSTVAAFNTFAQMVNGGTNYFEGVTVKLGADIDLAGQEWTPIGSAAKDHGFMGNFDGNGYVVKNLNITNIALDADGYAYAGLFGITEGADEDNQNYIKNLTIENVTIETEGHIVAAAIAYPYYTELENILVKGNVSIKGGDYTSGVLAYTRRLVDAENIAIEAKAGSSIEGNKTVGGVISDIQMNGGLTANYSNFKAKNLTVKGVMHVGGISGILSKQTLNGVSVENVTIICDDARKGKVSGSLGEDSALNNVSVENVEGADNLVGATFKEGTTHTLTVDGVVYEYLANGTCKVDGKLVVDNNDQFQAAIAAGETSIVLGKGTFDLPSSLTQNEGTLTIVGAGVEETILNGAMNTNGNHPGNYANGVALEFEGLTFKTANNGYNGGFGHAVSVTFRESKIVGQFYAHSDAPHYFYDCTIDPLTGYLYTYGSDCVFEGCTFAASEGKALQIYEDAASGENTVTITNCAFVAAKQATTWDGKPVTGIDINSNGAKFEVYINNCTTTGFPTGLNSNSDLWNVKDAGKAHVNVYVDGAQVWEAGNLASGVKVNEAGEYLISNAAGMFWFANEVNVNKNTFSGKTVKLANDIDLNNVAWTPIGQTGATQFKGTFDGNNKTISNLNIDTTAENGEYYSTGVFGWLLAAKVKNVIVDGASIKGNHNVATIAGYLEWEGCSVENCQVKNATIIGNYKNADLDGDKCGVIAGYVGNAGTLVKNCTATDCTVTASRDAGQVVGAGKAANVTDCVATNVAVSHNGQGTGANIRNEVIGRLL